MARVLLRRSLINALFRLIEPAATTTTVAAAATTTTAESDGSEAVGGPPPQMRLNGVDVTKVGLRTLRRSLAVIPQTPWLFEGSVRAAEQLKHGMCGLD